MIKALNIYLAVMVIILTFAVTAISAPITTVSYTYVTNPLPDNWADPGNTKLKDGVTGSFFDLFAGWPNVRVGFNPGCCDIIFDFGQTMQFTSVSSDTFRRDIYDLNPSVKRHVAASNSPNGPWDYTVSSTFTPPADMTGKLNTSSFTGSGRYLRVREYVQSAGMTVSEFTFDGNSVAASSVVPSSYSYVINPSPDIGTWIDPGNTKLKDGITGSLSDLFDGWPNVRVGFYPACYPICYDVIFDFGQAIQFTSVTADTWRRDYFGISASLQRKVAASNSSDPNGAWQYTASSFTAPADMTGRLNTSSFTGYGRYLRLWETTNNNNLITVSEVTFQGYVFPKVYLHNLRYSSALLLGAMWPQGVSSIAPSSISLVITSGGNTVFSTSVTGTEAFEGKVIPVNLSAGTYHVTVTTTLPNSESAVSIDRDMLYTPTPANAIVKFRDDGACLNNGTAFFPIGIYHTNSNDLQTVHNAGFNFTAPQQDIPTPPPWDCQNDGNGYIEKCATEGIKGMGIGFGYLAPGDPTGQALLQYYTGNANVLFWYVMDEPALSTLNNCRINYENGISWDATHPFLILQNAPDNQLSDLVNYYAATAEAGDVFSVEPYIIQGDNIQPLQGVSNIVKMGVKSVFGKKPVWAAIQSYTLKNLSTGAFGNPRLPTRWELECMSYLALASGARGLMYYAFDDSLGNDGTWRGVNLQVDRSDYWNNALIPCVSGINAHSDIWTAPYSSDSPVNETPNIVVQNKPYTLNNNVYMLVVNPEYYTTQAVRIWIPRAWAGSSTATDLMGGTSGSVSGGILTDTLAPLQTKCYVLPL